MNIAICIPIFNPGDQFGRLISALASQTVRPDRILLIDSSPISDPSLAGLPTPFQAVRIAGKDFDHGGTRRLALDVLTGEDLVVFLTQDAIPTDRRSVANLIAPFVDEKVGAVFGRQLPKVNAGPIEAHARRFNYPPESLMKSAGCIPLMGLKTAFISNTFAAYRRSALEAVDSFPARSIVSEDTFVAAQMLLAGWKVAYCAEAQVYHSHAYNWRREFQRYFDIGVFHAREPWIREKFGGAEGEGGRFLRSEMKYLGRHAPHLIPSALVRTVVKYLGFRAGLMEKYLPLQVKRWMSMQKAFWNAEQGDSQCSENKQNSSTV